jgi:hypothetical protein
MAEGLDLGFGLWRWVKRWRVELAFAIVAVILRSLLAPLLGAGWARFALVAGVIAALGTPAHPGYLGPLLVRSRGRRSWERALGSVYPAASPTLLDHGIDRAGRWAVVHVPAGGTVAELVKKADALAGCFGVMAVRVRPEPHNAGRARLQAVRRDALEVVSAQAWPWPDSRATSLWHPVPVGVDEDGQLVAVTLFEHNLLVGGEPGAGKSVAISQLVAAAALDPFATLWLLDGKVVELAAWRRCARGFAGADITEATMLLLRVRQVMDDRYQQLLEAGRRKIAHGTGLHVVVIDELALYSTWPERKARDHFAEVLRDLVARGRAAGVIVIVATQKPSSEVVPTSLRDLFGHRWALRCTTDAASDTILGSGWATRGTSAALINPAQRGVGWLLHESGQPVRLRAFHLDDHDIDAIAARAAALRTERQADDR